MPEIKRVPLHKTIKAAEVIKGLGSAKKQEELERLLSLRKRIMAEFSQIALVRPLTDAEKAEFKTLKAWKRPVK